MRKTLLNRRDRRTGTIDFVGLDRQEGSELIVGVHGNTDAGVRIIRIDGVWQDVGPAIQTLTADEVRRYIDMSPREIIDEAAEEMQWYEEP